MKFKFLLKLHKLIIISIKCNSFKFGRENFHSPFYFLGPQNPVYSTKHREGVEREKDTYMLTTWQTVSSRKEQLQVTAFSNPFVALGVVQLLLPLQGSTLKSQFLFPNVFAMSFRTSTSHTYDHN